GGVVDEAAVGDVLVDAGKALVNDAARAQVHVADLGVAHLAFRQADLQAGGVDQGVRAGGPETVPDRRVRHRDGVVPGFFTMTPAIQNQQQGGAFGVLSHDVLMYLMIRRKKWGKNGDGVNLKMGSE